MSGQKFFRSPFALTGDKTAIPDVAEPDGSISYPQGFGPKYAIDPSDPDALLVPREETNQYLYDITDNLRQYQLAGFPEWVASAQNGGSPVSYPLSAHVIHGGPSWKVYRAIVSGAVLEPGVASGWESEWAEVAAASGTPLYSGNNLSDVANVATARNNLGLGTMATQAAGAYLTVAAPAYTGGISGTGGARVDGGTSGNVNTLSGGTIGWNLSDFHTRAMTANQTFTFTGIPSGRAAALFLRLTVSNGAVPTWPASVQWPGGTAPVLSNGVHLLGFVTYDGGTTVLGVVIGENFA